jgi:hypothetical protein
MSSASATPGRGCVNSGVHLHVAVAVAVAVKVDAYGHDQINDHGHVPGLQKRATSNVAQRARTE